MAHDMKVGDHVQSGVRVGRILAIGDGGSAVVAWDKWKDDTGEHGPKKTEIALHALTPAPAELTAPAEESQPVGKPQPVKRALFAKG